MIEVKVMRGLELHSIVCLDTSQGEVFVGRDKSCQLRLSGLSVSGRHFKISTAPSGFILRDLETIFGTRVNGQPQREYGPLADQDMIEIPGWRLEVIRVGVDVRDMADREAIVVNGMVDQSEIVPKPRAPTGKACADHLFVEPPVDLPRLRSAALVLREALDSRQREWAGMSDSAMRAECRQLAMSLGQIGVGTSEGDSFLERLIAEVVGLGPLETFLKDPTVTEIMVNGPDKIFIERSGVCAETGDQFMDAASLRNITERIFAPLGRRIDDGSPLADGRLPDGSRVNAVLSPPAIHGPCLTIRKFSDDIRSLESLVDRGALDKDLAKRLRQLVLEKRNIIVSGGTGSGKTTLLRALAGCIPNHERLITIEDAAELRLSAANLVSLEAREANQEGEGQLAIRDLLRNALRMRPDRIIVGECRGGEAIDMLQAMNTGHEGSLTSVHANSPRDALSRLELMVLMSGFDIPISAIREQIRASIDLIVHQRRFGDGSRRIVAVEEVCGIESGVIQTQPLFWVQDGSSAIAHEVSP